jgi:hypothetical protein
MISLKYEDFNLKIERQVVSLKYEDFNLKIERQVVSLKYEDFNLNIEGQMLYVSTSSIQVSGFHSEDKSLRNI